MAEAGEFDEDPEVAVQQLEVRRALVAGLAEAVAKPESTIADATVLMFGQTSDEGWVFRQRAKTRDACLSWPGLSFFVFSPVQLLEVPATGWLGCREGAGADESGERVAHEEPRQTRGHEEEHCV